MIKQLEIDDQTLALVRREDPINDPRATGHPLLDTESALRVAHARISAPGITRRRARHVFALGGVAVAAAAAVVVALNVGSTGHGALSHALDNAGIGTPTADAATIKARALDVLDPAAGSILVVDEATTQNDGDGTSESWDYKYWTATTYPYANRVIQTQAGTPTAESSMTPSGYQQIYDPTTNTIYEYHPGYTFTPAATAGSEGLTVPSYRIIKSTGSASLPAGDTGMTTLTLSQAQVSALKTGADEIAYKKLTLDSAGNTVIGSDPYAAINHGYVIDPATQWADPIKKLLSDPNATVDRSASYDGQPAIKITSTTAGGTIAYWVAPGTYRPLQEITTGPAAGNGNGKALTMTVTSTFPTYQTLTSNATSQNLLSLAAQHPAAKLDTNESDYQAAESRIYPNG